MIKKIKPKEIYNLAAQSYVADSFNLPKLTTNADALGTLRILESIIRINKKIKFYQAGSSEMFGKVVEIPQTEKTPFYPRSPYGVAKVYSHWITVNYRETHKIFACNGIYLIMKVHSEVKISDKIIKALCKLNLKKKKNYFRNQFKKEIIMLRIMFKLCGKCYKINIQMIL